MRTERLCKIFVAALLCGLCPEMSAQQAVAQEERADTDGRDSTFEDTGVLNGGSEGSGQGLSAMFCGLVSGKAVCAGGANFPETPAMYGGRKHYYKDIFRFTGKWEKCGELLCPLAYGASFSVGGRMLTVGGNDGRGPVDKVFCISPARDGVRVEELESGLPQALEQAGYASDGRNLYIAGGLSSDGASRKIYRGRVKRNRTEWSLIAELPQNLVQPVAMVFRGHLLVWGGFDPEGKTALSACWDIDLRSGECVEAGNVPGGGTFTGSALVTLDNGKGAVIGGTDRETFNRGLNAQGKQKEEYMSMPPANYKFNRKILIFNPYDKTWSVPAESGKAALAGAGCVCDSKYLYIIGGETKPGVRTPQTWRIPLSSIK
ncbi:MAG: hypothetical protein ACI395_10830 [Candidatus Cryptobacteroides sp.]